IVLLTLSLFVENFLTTRNTINVLMQSAALGLMAIGMSVVLIGGGIDLSIPSVMAFSAIVGAIFMRDVGSPVIGAALMVVVGTLAGCINGYAVAYLKMIPFVVTLAMMTIMTGASIWITNSVSVPIYSFDFIDAVLYRVGNVPAPVIFVAIITVIVFFISSRSLFGRWLYAVGTNAEAARVAGIPTRGVLFGTYIVSGFFAGLAAIVVAARLGAASASIGPDQLVLDIVSAAVVGGVSIYGGVGSPLGAVVGAVIITLISNSMNMMQVPYTATLIIKGIVIIAFVALDGLRRR
ncbi:MAG: ABC transporter permease, partial [Chloroflexi bacterium]|nr:ABC transporter permease [Chloroflexota bacterium]